MRILILLTLIVLSSFVNAELKDDGLLTRTVIVHDNRSKIQCSLLVEKVKRKTELNTLYFWYRNDQIKSNAGGYSGNLLHGLYQKYDEQKNLIEEGKYSYGTKIGLWKYWNEHGEVTRTIEYKSGKQNGLDCIYKSEQIWEKSTYKSNQLHGRRLVQSKDSLFVETYRYGKLIRKKAESLVKTPKVKVEKKKEKGNKRKLKEAEKEFINNEV